MDLDLGMPKIARANHLSGQIPNTVTTRIEGLTLEGKPLLTHTLVTYFHHPIDGFAYAVMYFSVPESLIKFIADETTVHVTYQGEQRVLLESFRNHRFGHIKLPRSMNKSDGVLGERHYIGYSMISLPTAQGSEPVELGELESGVHSASLSVIGGDCASVVAE